MPRQELLTQHRCHKVFNPTTYTLTEERLDKRVAYDTTGLNCRLCKNMLRSPLACRTCSACYCQKCLLESNSYLSTKRCPNSECNARDDFTFLPTSIMERLFKFSIICTVCTKSVRYSEFEAHELEHHSCELCQQAVPQGWTAIANHYNSSCPKAQVSCKHCIFKFTVTEYASHNCASHYWLRAIEASLFGLTFLLLALHGKIIQRLPVDECTSMVSRLQNLMVDFLVNHVLVFWAVAMYFNMRSVQRKPKMGKQFQLNAKSFTGKLMDVLEGLDVDYLVKFCCCMVFIFTVLMNQNLNRLHCAFNPDAVKTYLE